MHDPEALRTIHKLLDTFGEERCLALGFLGRDDNATLFVSTMGLGYLLHVEAAELADLAEAYAAGYRQGYDDAEGKLTA